MTMTAGDDGTSGPMEQRVSRLRTIQRTEAGSHLLSAEVVLRLRERIRANVYATPSVLDEIARTMLLVGDI
ncbi:MAG: hypothetical protein V4550_01845 [Gemmatimonadota bacterium]